ncbi:uncharacterized protein Triagg1_4837 [Trichoderma aggressivum f. europaeum]|uniref:Uncharacterized protein n=1 Tax=Trichoderma aggressivum f. europaeum TaxID=173218 RepID=A0AAE1M326_9HYPO|nr:hypothetical protein Triagg1_4837 [Trichoderma aggressivum f. europaeum]
MAGVKSALPTHLMPNPEGDFEQRHHGKTRSHMASSPSFSFPSFYGLLLVTVVALALALTFTAMRALATREERQLATALA